MFRFPPILLVALFGLTCAVNLHAADDGWVQLFNGKDFTGWKMVNPPSGEFESVSETKNADGKVIAFVGKTKAKKGKDGKETASKEITLWQIKDGCIVGGGPASHIFSERGDYTDFSYRVEAKINDKGNSGQYFRTELGGGFPKGYEAQINATHGDAVKTGSLYPSNGLGKDKAKHTVMNTAPHKADEFFTQEVTAVGPKVTILVNGKQTVEWTLEEPYFKKGHFALQGHDPGSVMTFKKVEVKELKK
ncbi:DUF1080 domain-containing protein [soil metagenome]